MANPPPPYANITGISRTVMKDNAQETLGNYNGNARPGEIVVDLTQDPPVPYIGNNVGQLTLLSSAGSYGNTQVAQYLTAGLVGNIIPAGNNINSLGNATNQWNGLYISNTTIYMNGVPISLGAGNTLTIDGNAVLTNNSNTSVSTTGNITADYFIGDGSLLTNLPGGGNATLPLSNGTSNFNIATANGNATITTDGTWTWTFGTDGNLTIPNDILSNTTIEIDNRASGNSADIRLFSADDITLQARDRTLGSTSEGGDININAGDSAEDGDSSGGDIQIIAGNGGAANLDFGGSGGFITIRSGDGGPAIGNSGYTALNGGDITIQAGYAGDNNGNIDLGATGGDVFIYSGFSTGNTNSGGNIVLSTGTGGQNGTSGNVQINIPGYGLTTGGTWTFDATGNLNLPQSAVIYETSSPTGLGNATGIRPSQYDGDPDQTLLIYPTGGEGNHLHLTTGNLYNTMMYVGNDDYYVRLNTSGNIDLQANDNAGNAAQYNFGTDGVLTLPGEGVLRSIGDSVTLQTLNTISGNANSVYLGTSGGLGFNDQEIGGNWLEIFRNGTEPEIRVPVGRGNLNIQTAEGNIAYNWTFDNTGNLTAAGNISTTGSGGDITLTGGDILGVNIVVTTPVPVANLTAVAGGRAFVNNSNVVALGNFGNIVSSGGSNVVPVWSDGINWYIG